jgi:hypothetical protein
MMLFGTLAVIALWLAFVWICDPDGFGEARTRAALARSRSAGKDPGE